MKVLSYNTLRRHAGALLAAACLAGATAASHAAELGDAAVKSYIGQPLIADIELVQLSDDDFASLNVKLARPDVYRGGGITADPVLSSVHMSVMRRDRKMFLHVTTIRPVQANYVHLYLELTNARTEIVRLATLWFEQDPRPPAPPEPEKAPPVLSEEPPSPALQAAIARARQQANYPPPVRTESADSCARSGRACAVLAVKNAELNKQIVDLEGKVKLMQAKLGDPEAPASAHAASASAPAASAPAPAAAASEHASAPRPAAPSASAHAASAHAAAAASAASKPEKKGVQTDWVMLGSIGGGVVALGLLVWFLLRRKKNKGAEKAPGRLAKVWARLRRKESKSTELVPEQEQVEPVLDA